MCGEIHIMILLLSSFFLVDLPLNPGPDDIYSVNRSVLII